MKNCPAYSYTLESPLAPEEALRRIAAALAEGKEFAGSASGNGFAMHNHSKLPAQVSGTVTAAASGSAIAVRIEQDGRLTMWELVVLVAVWPVAGIFFPDFMTDPLHTIPVAALLMLALYGLGFYSEIEKSRVFLAEVAEVPDMLDAPGEP